MEAPPRIAPVLWFDVENERYTTLPLAFGLPERLWFDVENERYTTNTYKYRPPCGLWFDVGKRRDMKAESETAVLLIDLVLSL